MALSFAKFPSALSACRKFSTQIGVSAAMTAFSAWRCAISPALPPVIQPPYEKPIPASARAPPTAPQRIRSTFGESFIEKAMVHPFVRSGSERESTGPGWAPGQRGDFQVWAAERDVLASGCEITLLPVSAKVEE